MPVYIHEIYLGNNFHKSCYINACNSRYNMATVLSLFEDLLKNKDIFIWKIKLEVKLLGLLIQNGANIIWPIQI